LSNESVSRKQLILEIDGKIKLSCDLKRHLSPRTVGTIMRSLPLEGNSHLLGKRLFILKLVLTRELNEPDLNLRKVMLHFYLQLVVFVFLLEMLNLQKLWLLLENLRMIMMN